MCKKYQKCSSFFFRKTRPIFIDVVVFFWFVLLIIFFRYYVEMPKAWAVLLPYQCVNAEKKTKKIKSVVVVQFVTHLNVLTAKPIFCCVAKMLIWNTLDTIKKSWLLVVVVMVVVVIEIHKKRKKSFAYFYIYILILLIVLFTNILSST